MCIPGFDNFTHSMSMRGLSFNLYSHDSKQQYLFMDNAPSNLRLTSLSKFQYIQIQRKKKGKKIATFRVDII